MLYLHHMSRKDITKGEVISLVKKLENYNTGNRLLVYCVEFGPNRMCHQYSLCLCTCNFQSSRCPCDSLSMKWKLGKGNG